MKVAIVGLSIVGKVMVKLFPSADVVHDCSFLQR